MRLCSVINAAFNYVIHASKLFNIDESHALRHSMDVYQFANKIYTDEVIKYPYLEEQKDIIMCSAILHDMCDKKYVNQQHGIETMNQYLAPHIKETDLSVINQIISTMSYSTVKKQGYPQLHSYDKAYHIVREADLLAAYDVERCIIYQMMHENTAYVDSILDAQCLFDIRVFTYLKDNLFTLDYSKKQARILHKKSKLKMKELSELYDILS